MHLQELTEATCPYCGEHIQLLVDCSVPHQEYIEDCQVCCQPMRISASINEDGIPELDVRSEDEV